MTILEDVQLVISVQMRQDLISINRVNQVIIVLKGVKIRLSAHKDSINLTCNLILV